MSTFIFGLICFAAGALVGVGLLALLVAGREHEDH